MGAGSSTTYCVDDKTTGHVEGFAKSIFIKYEFPTLKVFCNTYDIRQRHLVTVFKCYLSYEEVFINEFRVRTNDLKRKFLRHTRLNNVSIIDYYKFAYRVVKELADIFFPAIYTIPFKGIEDPTINDQFTFPRFCILSYIFGLQQIPDLFLQYFALLRRNLKLKISAFFFYYNIENMLRTLTEELKRTTALKIVMRCLANEAPDREVALRDVVKLGLKYPLMFYSLIRFRRLFMRFVYGDKFWQGRKLLKLKMKMDDILEHFTIEQVTSRFANEKIAMQMTAIAIITDIAAGLADGDEYHFNIAVVPYVTELNEAILLAVKDKLGYKDAKELIEESGLPITFTPLFMYNYEQLEASAAAEREESEREAAEYSQMLSSLSKSRKSNEEGDSDEDSLESDENDYEEEEDAEDAAAAADAEAEEDEQKDTEGPPPSLTSSKSSRGMLSAVGGSFKFLTRGMSSKNIQPPPVESAIDESGEGEREDEDGSKYGDEHAKPVETEGNRGGEGSTARQTTAEGQETEENESTAAPAPKLSKKEKSSKSLRSSLKKQLSRRSGSGRNLELSNDNNDDYDEDDHSLDGEAIGSIKDAYDVGGSSSSGNGRSVRKSEKKTSAVANATGGDEDDAEEHKAAADNDDGEGEGASGKHSGGGGGSSKSRKLVKQKSLGYDFNAVMKNLDASEGDTSDEESRKKGGKKGNGHGGGQGRYNDDEEEEREIVLDKTPVHGGIQVIYDAQYQRQFKYNVVSGRSSWALDIRGGGGGVIKQIWS